MVFFCVFAFLLLAMALTFLRFQLARQGEVEDERRARIALEKKVSSLASELSNERERANVAEKEVIAARSEMSKAKSGAKVVQGQLEEARKRLMNAEEEVHGRDILEGSLEQRISDLEKEVELRASEAADAHGEALHISTDFGHALQCMQRLFDAVNHKSDYSAACGIGMEIEGPLLNEGNQCPVVTGTVRHSPAEKASKIQKGLLLEEVDGIAVHGMSVDQVSDLIVGTAGTPVCLALGDPTTGKRYLVSVVRSGGAAGDGKLDENTVETCKQVASLHDEVGRLSGVAKRLEVELDERIASAQQAAVELKEAVAEARKHKDTISALEHKVEAAADGARASELRAADHSYDLEKANAEASRLKTDLESEVAARKEASEKLDVASGELVKERGRAKALEVECASLKKRMQKAEESLDKGRDEAKQQVAELQDAVDQAKAKEQKMLLEMTSTVEGLKSSRAEAMDDAERQAGRVLELEAALEDARVKLRAKGRASIAEMTVAQFEAARMARELAIATVGVQRVYEKVCQSTSTVGGIGAKFEQGVSAAGSNKTRIVVQELVENGPAAQDGKVSVGDVVLEIDGQDVSLCSLDEVKRLTEGPVGSTVVVKFQKQDQALAGGSVGDEGAHTCFAHLVRSDGAGGKVDGTDRTLTEICTKADALHSSVASLTEEVARLKEENASMSSELEHELSRFGRDKGDAEKGLASLKREAEKLRSRVVELEGKLATSKIELKQAQDVAGTSEAELAGLRGKNKSLSERLLTSLKKY